METAARRARIAGEVKAELARQGKTLTDLAYALGVSAPTLRDRLSARRSFTMDEMAGVAVFLGVSLSDLVVRAENAA